MNVNAKIIASIVAIAIGLLYWVGGFSVVEPGEYAITVKQFGSNKGVSETGLATGTHWIDPFTYDVVTYDTRANQFPLEVEASTKDGQPVKVTASFEISLEADKVRNLHSLIGHDYYEKVVAPAATAAIRDALPTQLSDKVYTDAGRVFIQQSVAKALEEKNIASRGIIVHTNLQQITFLNEAFVNILEQKAGAAQLEEIERRKALAAEQTAFSVINTAEGEKQKEIKIAEGIREKMRLEGQGSRLRDEETAKGKLALKQAEAEGQRLLVNAYGNNPGIVAQIEWARNVGNKIQIYGIPTGAPGTTSLIDLNSVIKEGLSGAVK